MTRLMPRTSFMMPSRCGPGIRAGAGSNRRSVTRFRAETFGAGRNASVHPVARRRATINRRASESGGKGVAILTSAWRAMCSRPTAAPFLAKAN
jgi:hypothetical protein